MSEENNDSNDSALQPRFNIGDVVWLPVVGRDDNGSPIFFKTKVLALVFTRGKGETRFFGYKTLDDESCEVKKPNVLFATKEECEAFVDEMINI